VGVDVSVHGYLGTVGLIGHRPGHHTRRLLRSRQRHRALGGRTDYQRLRSSGHLLRHVRLRRCLASYLRRLPEGLSGVGHYVERIDSCMVAVTFTHSSVV